MFVSALPDPTCNSEKSANGGNKQILLLLLLLFLHFFFLRMEVNHQRIKLEQNPTPLFVQTTIIIYIEMKFNNIESLPTTVTSTVFESLPSSFSASRVY